MKKLKMKMTNLPITIFKEGKSYVAYSPALDLSTSSSTYKGVQARFSEIVEIFFEEIMKMGTLDRVLSDLGWRKVKSKWQPPVIVSNYVQPMNLSYA